MSLTATFALKVRASVPEGCEKSGSSGSPAFKAQLGKNHFRGYSLRTEARLIWLGSISVLGEQSEKSTCLVLRVVTCILRYEADV